MSGHTPWADLRRVRQYRIMYTQRGVWAGPPSVRTTRLKPLLWWADADTTEPDDMLAASGLADMINECREFSDDIVDVWLEVRTVSNWRPLNYNHVAGPVQPPLDHQDLP